VISVADRRVQLGQVVALFLDDGGGGGDPGPEDFGLHGVSPTFWGLVLLAGSRAQGRAYRPVCPRALGNQ